MCACALSLAAINGFVFGNLPKIELCQGQAVAWHLFGMGNEMDIHSAYFHGNTLLDRGHRTDVLGLFPATFATANMVPKAIGKWRLSCQVNDHLHGRVPCWLTWWGAVSRCLTQQCFCVVLGFL